MLSLLTSIKNQAVIFHFITMFNCHYDGHLPAYVNTTNGKTADNKGAYDILLIKRSVIVADTFYNDFSLLNVYDSNKVFFVIRHKENLQFTKIKENNLPENHHEHILIGEIIELANQTSKKSIRKSLEGLLCRMKRMKMK